MPKGERKPTPARLEINRIEGITRELRTIFEADLKKQMIDAKAEMLDVLINKRPDISVEEVNYLLGLEPEKIYRAFHTVNASTKFPEAYFFAMIKGIVLFQEKAGRLPRIAEIAKIVRSTDAKLVNQINDKIAPSSLPGLRKKLVFSLPKPVVPDAQA